MFTAAQTYQALLEQTHYVKSVELWSVIKLECCLHIIQSNQLSEIFLHYKKSRILSPNMCIYLIFFDFHYFDGKYLDSSMTAFLNPTPDDII